MPGTGETCARPGQAQAFSCQPAVIFRHRLDAARVRQGHLLAVAIVVDPASGDLVAGREPDALVAFDMLDQAFQRRRALLESTLAGWEPTDIAEFERLLAKFVDGVNSQTSTDPT